MKFFTAFIICVLAISAVSQAETIFLKDGSWLTGEVVGRTDYGIEVRLENDAQIVLRKKDIARVDSNPAHILNYADIDRHLFNWMRANVSPVTGLPLSFYIPKDSKAKVYAKMGKPDSVTGIIERTIVEEGLEIYDGALWQIAFCHQGQDGLRLAQLPVRHYWNGSLGNLAIIRAGYSGQPFIYDMSKPDDVLASVEAKGKRGFIFRIINAHGNYQMSDPLDSKKTLEGFPNYDRIHWEDWKPIAGENAWVVMGALHVLHQKYFDRGSGEYTRFEGSEEFMLAQELTRAAVLLQAENGGIRMAPLGTYHNPNAEKNNHYSLDERIELLDSVVKQTPAIVPVSEDTDLVQVVSAEDFKWHYSEISTENNLSWYAAFRMLYQITGQEDYMQAMEAIEHYFRSVWNEEENIFYQGAHFQNGGWRPNTKHFASDVQNWAIAVLGPERIDEWFGPGKAMAVWRTVKEKSGYIGNDGTLWGVGFTEEHDRLSIEWTCGAVLAARKLADFYAQSHPDWAMEAREDAHSMRLGVDHFRVQISPGQEAYSYSSRRGWIPFGWFSHGPEVLSLASTAWITLIDLGVDPFVLD